MDESVILKVMVDREELRLLAPVMKLVKKAGEHTEASLSGIFPRGDPYQRDRGHTGQPAGRRDRGITG